MTQGDPTRYRTIVADPPWQARFRTGKGDLSVAVPYPQLSVAEIAALPVADMASEDAHLYLWTINSRLRDAFAIVETWGFRFSTVLVWCKTAHGLVSGGAYPIGTEFCLFARRGSLASMSRADRNWFDWPVMRSKGPNHGAIPSRKPEAFLDVVEAVSPGPYLELFARRNRLGWDTWGNEALEHVSLGETQPT
jgi:N6-adenosine-specific RNA methylase IME4